MRLFELFASVLAASAAVEAGPSEPVFESAGHIPLSHRSIYAITQDAAGFLWFGTAAGLNRYDGYEVRRFLHDAEDPGTLSSNLISTLFEDSAGRLWVGTQYGLNCLDPRRDRLVRVRLEESPAPLPIVATITEDERKVVWVGTDRGVFFGRSAEEGFRRLQVVSGNSRIKVMGFERAGAGLLRVLFRRESQELGLATIDTASARVLESGRAEPGQRPDEFVPEWKWVLDAPEPSFYYAGGTATGSGDRWFGLASGLAHYPADGPASLIRLGSDGYLDNFVRAVFEDRAGTVWVGTHDGLFRSDPTARTFRHWRHDPDDPASLAVDAISAVEEWKQGTLLVGTFGGGLYEWEPGSDRFVRLDTTGTGLRIDIVWALLADGSGGVWIGTPTGLGRLRPDGAIRRVVLPGSSQSNVRSLARSADDDLFVGTTDGLFVRDPRGGTFARVPLPGSGAADSAVIESILATDSGEIWAGTVDRLLKIVRRSDGQFEVRSLGLPSRGEGVWDLHQAGDGRIWVGSGLGLSVLDPETEEFRHLGAGDRTAGTIVYSILEDHSGTLWLGTSEGLARLDSANGLQGYSLMPSLPRTEFNRRAAWIGPDGLMVFGGMDGLLSFQPRAGDQVAPPIAVTRIDIASRDVARSLHPLDGDTLQLSHSDYSVSFEFAALDFTSPPQNRYSYMMEGFDPAWSEPGPRRFVQYTSLPPGPYTFRVRGTNEDGTWSEAGVSLPVFVAPPIWATWWFRALAVGFVVAAAGLAYRYRVRRLLELERLRLQVAGDLHDDLGSNLSGIALLGERLQRQPEFGERERRQLGRITDSAQKMVEDLRDIVWLVDPAHDQFSDLVARMRDFTAHFADAVEFEFNARESEDRPLRMATRRQVFLIFKEALNNVVRHSGARHVRVDFRCRGDALILEIEDDGVGIAESDREQGHGLASMRRRAESLGGSLSIGKGPRGGTRICLEAKMA